MVITGTVYDIRPYLWRASASVVPLLYGAGIQNKILEPMVTGTPVITTTRTLSALEAQPGRDLLSADSAVAFAGEVLALLADPLLQARVAVAGLEYVRARHEWKAIAERLTDLYQQTLPGTVA